jgi:predicted DNA binding CopG/RHH family protein
MADRHKDKPLSIRLPEAERLAVEAKAAEEGWPVRRVILEAIRTYLGIRDQDGHANDRGGSDERS